VRKPRNHSHTSCRRADRIAAFAPWERLNSSPARPRRALFSCQTIASSRRGPSSKAAEQLDGADPASRGLRSARYWSWLAGRLISRPFGGLAFRGSRDR
jgi:hypothetical protein